MRYLLRHVVVTVLLVILVVRKRHLVPALFHLARGVGPIAAISKGDPWIWDDPHQPSAWFPQYILTGDPWYLDMMYAWAGITVATTDGDGGNEPRFRGPSGAYGGIARASVRSAGVRCMSRGWQKCALIPVHRAFQRLRAVSWRFRPLPRAQRTILPLHKTPEGATLAHYHRGWRMSVDTRLSINPI